MPDRHRRRAGSARIAGRSRSRYLATRLGIALKESRLALALTQAQAGERAGVSQAFWSELERGNGTVASLETLAACAAAVESQLAAFVEARPGSDLPRDIAHLRGQARIIAFATSGGWSADPELRIDAGSRRSRAVDVVLRRAERRELIVVELVDLIADGGEAMRGLADKVAAVRRDHPRDRVVGLLVVRATRRNRALLRELRGLIRARFPSRSADWIAALTQVDAPMPPADGVVWARVDGSALFEVRSTAA
jgi:transcriptional regulator with XRE-family HTH domain